VGDGASLVQKENLELWKRDFGERSYSSLERARRGGEKYLIIGGQSGICGGENDGEDGDGSGFFWWQKKKKMEVKLML